MRFIVISFSFPFARNFCCLGKREPHEANHSSQRGRINSSKHKFRLGRKYGAARSGSVRHIKVSGAFLAPIVT